MNVGILECKVSILKFAALKIMLAKRNNISKLIL